MAVRRRGSVCGGLRSLQRGRHQRKKVIGIHAHQRLPLRIRDTSIRSLMSATRRLAADDTEQVPTTFTYVWRVSVNM
jgi:hypothetical protein